MSLYLVPPPGVPEPLSPRERLIDLADEETRLLARATGEHLPHELQVRVDWIRAERSRLARQVGEGRT